MLTQQQLAEKVSLTPGFISRIETGKKKPSLEVLLSICVALNITLNDLLVGNQIPQESDYNVEFTDEDKKDLTPFARNMTELYYDSENIDIVRPNFAMLWSPLQYTSDRGSFDYFVPKINGVTQAQPYKTVRTYSLDQIKTGLPQFFNATDWASWIKQAQDEGFYQD